MVQEATSNLLCIPVSVSSPYTGIYARRKEVLVAFVYGYKPPFPISIQMPCGKIVTFKNSSELPDQSLPCTCGRDDHWFIKYEVS